MASDLTWGARAGRHRGVSSLHGDPVLGGGDPGDGGYLEAGPAACSCLLPDCRGGRVDLLQAVSAVLDAHRDAAPRAFPDDRREQVRARPVPHNRRRLAGQVVNGTDVAAAGEAGLGEHPAPEQAERVLVADRRGTDLLDEPADDRIVSVRRGRYLPGRLGLGGAQGHHGGQAQGGGAATEQREAPDSPGDDHTDAFLLHASGWPSPRLEISGWRIWPISAQGD